MSKNALLMYSCDWYQGGLWRYAYNLGCQLSLIDQHGDYSFIHGHKKPENFAGLQQGERIIPLKGWEKVFKLPGILKREGFNLVHQTENSCPLFSKKQKYRKVITIHDLTPYKFPKFFSKREYIYYRFYLPQALKTVDAIIAPSQSTKQDLVELYGVKSEKVTVIHEGLEEAFFCQYSPQETKAMLDSKGLSKPYLLTMGINYHRNLGTVFKAYAALPEDIKDSYDLVVAGYTGIEDGKDIRFLGRGTENIVNLVRDLGLKQHVKFVGRLKQEDLMMLYQSAEIFLFPSLSEGFGFPPLEAMASGCPVISSSASAMKETVGDAGILLEPLDPEKWSGAIEQVLQSGDIKRSLIDKGLKRAKSFSWEKCAQGHLGVYYA